MILFRLKRYLSNNKLYITRINNQLIKIKQNSEFIIYITSTKRILIYHFRNKYLINKIRQNAFIQIKTIH